MTTPKKRDTSQQVTLFKDHPKISQWEIDKIHAEAVEEIAVLDSLLQMGGRATLDQLKRLIPSIQRAMINKALLRQKDAGNVIMRIYRRRKYWELT
jgi:hypothetical protein